MTARSIKTGLAFTLAGVGTYEPRTVVTSDELDARHGRPAGTSAALGIDRRRYAAADETSSVMAAAATRRAIDDAGWQMHEFDVLIGACGVMEQPIPGTASLVQRQLGLGGSGLPAFDVNATCLSFLPALDHAVAGMALGRWRRAVVFAADIASAALDHGDLESSAIFGDGAAAVAIEADGPSRLLASRLETYGDEADLCRLEAGGTRLRPFEDLDGFLAKARFRMEGMALFKATARRFPPFLARLMDEAGVTLAELGSIIPHQASAPAIFAERRHRLRLRADSPLAARPVNHYARTKLEAERLVRQERRMTTVILRPSAVIGPDDRAIMPRLLRVLSRGVFPIGNDGTALFHPTDVRDAADAFAVAALGSTTGTANVAGREPVRVIDLARALADRLGLGFRPRRLPEPLLHAIATAAEGWGAVSRREPPLTRYSVSTLSWSRTFDLAGTEALLGWRPAYAADDALAYAVPR